jgi:adenine-specific DNA-methyltransferase
MAKKTSSKTVETIKHDDATRKNIPTAEYQSVLRKDEQTPIRLAYERRNRDLDPQLVWRGKDEQDWSDLIVQAPPLYIQEKIHPKVLIDDLLNRSRADAKAADAQLDLFSDFNGIPEGADKTDFYQHDQNWSNRMILGDSLQVMASLAEREGLRGKVQCIYFDPPYGIKFNSNFQWSTTSRDVKDGNAGHITREPEQVKAFRDTWRDGIHSYLTYLRDRLTVARDLLTESGSIFVQIGEENMHRIRVVMDEVFGENNFVGQITFRTGSGFVARFIKTTSDYLLWYSKNTERTKFRRLFSDKSHGEDTYFDKLQTQNGEIIDPKRATPKQANESTPIALRPLVSAYSENTNYRFWHQGSEYYCGIARCWKTTPDGMKRLGINDRIYSSKNTLKFIARFSDFQYSEVAHVWEDTMELLSKNYVVQTSSKVIERCIHMTTDPGDLVLDPTCGSGTTAFVAEQWGRRWITIDTSRVALALARARIMGARYPFYLLADSREGQIKEAEVTRTIPSSQPVHGKIRQGFVYERVPHITLKSIANNTEIDVIWDKWQETLEPLREKLNAALSKKWEEWEIPREADPKWTETARQLHADWWQARIARQKEIDASIAAKAEFEYLYDKPYEDKKKVRVAGPFTVESLSPHRVLIVDEDDNPVDPVKESKNAEAESRDFVSMILENLKTSGVQQAHKEDKITFHSLTPWPGEMICAEARYTEGAESSAVEKRAAIFIGPEFGTVSRPDLVEAAREAGDAGFDVLISCAFNYEAHATEFSKLGRIPVLKARMNADLHMADDLKNTGKGNLFVIFGEPDIEIVTSGGDQIQVKINGVDVFHPNTGEIRSDGADGIACWFIDTDYNEESFFVRHAYFLGANDPYSSLKTTLKAEINADAWATLNSDISRPFDKPKSGRIAVKVINHLGDEVMKVFKVN